MRVRLSRGAKVCVVLIYALLTVYLYTRPEVNFPLWAYRATVGNDSLAGGGCGDPSASSYMDERTLRARLEQIRQQMKQQENPPPKLEKEQQER